MKRVIFVGMNNKPGKAPLCSSTRSGKLIDRLIEHLPKRLQVLKSNLYDLDYWPEADESPGIYQWAKRVEFSTDDIVVTLGSVVNHRFRDWHHKYVSIGHPASRFGNPSERDYIGNAVKKILEFEKRNT